MARSKKYRDSFVDAHISNTVAAQIAFLREANDWTQQQLATETGMKQSRISALEDPNNENFEIKTLKRLASAFDVGLHVEFVPFREIVARSTNVSLARTQPVSFTDDRLEDFKMDDRAEFVTIEPPRWLFSAQNPLPNPPIASKPSLTFPDPVFAEA